MLALETSKTNVSHSFSKSRANTDDFGSKPRQALHMNSETGKLANLGSHPASPDCHF